VLLALQTLLEVLGVDMELKVPMDSHMVEQVWTVWLVAAEEEMVECLDQAEVAEDLAALTKMVILLLPTQVLAVVVLPAIQEMLFLVMAVLVFVILDTLLKEQQLWNNTTYF
jgi:predicted ABC-type exoprotein transport system permease subunit